jgi:hypothetical protein
MRTKLSLSFSTLLLACAATVASAQTLPTFQATESDRRPDPGMTNAKSRRKAPAGHAGRRFESVI